MALPKSITRKNQDNLSSKSTLTLLALLSVLIMAAMATLAFDLGELMGLGLGASKIVFSMTVFGIGMACLVLFLFLTNKWGGKVRQQLAAVDEQNRRNQQAILLLLDEMMNVCTK